MDLFKTKRQTTTKMDLDKTEQVYVVFYGGRPFRQYWWCSLLKRKVVSAL